MPQDESERLGELNKQLDAQAVGRDLPAQGDLVDSYGGVPAGQGAGPRVTPADIEQLIMGEVYFTAGDAASSDSPTTLCIIKPTASFGLVKPSLQLLTICVLVLENGFTVSGTSACASPENFDATMGRKIAREKAISEIWPLAGYALKQRLHEHKRTGSMPHKTLENG